MSEEPLVSAIITNYNYGRFIDECIASVRAQTYPRVEIIVVDDGSTDNSREVLRRQQDVARIILKENAGQASAFDSGVAASGGEIICMLDADDTWHANKVARVVETFQQHARVEWVSHGLRVVDQDLRTRGSAGVVRAGLIPPDRRSLAERTFTAGSTISIRRSLANRVFPLNSTLFAGDAVLLARCVAAGGWGYTLDEPLSTYRRHDSQRYLHDADLVPLLQDQILVTSEMAHIVGIADATPIYKHRAVLGYLAGQPWYGRARLGSLLNGLRTAFSFVNQPGLFARQSAALLLAFAAPRVWLRRIEHP